MEEAAGNMLEELRKPQLSRTLKNAARRALGREVPVKDLLYWPAGMLVLGLMEAEKAIAAQPAGEQQKLPQKVREVLTAWEKGGEKLQYPDDALLAAAVLGSFAGGKELAERMEAFLEETERDELGLILYRPGRDDCEVLADGIGMSAMFLARRAGQLTGTDGMEEHVLTLLNEAYHQLRSFYLITLDPDSGLLWHGYELQADGSIVRKGLIGWGRAMGWYLMGLSELCCVMRELGVETDEDEEDPQKTFAKLLLKCFSLQRENGLLPWTFTDVVSLGGDLFRSVTSGELREALQSPDNAEEGEETARILAASEIPTDLSASAMIGYAAARALKAGVFDQAGSAAELGEKLRKLREGILSFVDESGQAGGALAECVGFGNHPQRYGIYPWGQGAALAFLSCELPETETGRRTS